MEKKFRIIMEYETVAPLVTVSLFDTIEEAFARIEEMYINCRRAWICEVKIFSDGAVSGTGRDILAAENGFVMTQFSSKL
jgi:hypothetical protein